MSPTCLHCDVTHLSLTSGVVDLHIPSWRAGVREEYRQALQTVWPVHAGSVIYRYQNNSFAIVNYKKHIWYCYLEVYVADVRMSPITLERWSTRLIFCNCSIFYVYFAKGIEIMERKRQFWSANNTISLYFTSLQKHGFSIKGWPYISVTAISHFILENLLCIMAYHDLFSGECRNIRCFAVLYSMSAIKVYISIVS